MTIVDELKKKIVAAGGDAAGVQTISDGVKKMSVGGGSAGSGVLFIEETSESGVHTLDHTWQEIFDALLGGVLVVLRQTDSNSFVNIIGLANLVGFSTKPVASYTVSVYNFSGGLSVLYTTTSASGYPAYVDE